MQKESETCGQTSDCEKIVHQLYEVKAQVTVSPLVEHGEAHIYCIGSEIKKACDCDYPKKSGCSHKKCTFVLSQIICVEIPITFGVNVEVEEGISGCHKPIIGPCNQHPIICK